MQFKLGDIVTIKPGVRWRHVSLKTQPFDHPVQAVVTYMPSDPYSTFQAHVSVLGSHNGGWGWTGNICYGDVYNAEVADAAKKAQHLLDSTPAIPQLNGLRVAVREELFKLGY